MQALRSAAGLVKYGNSRLYSMHPTQVGSVYGVHGRKKSDKSVHGNMRFAPVNERGARSAVGHGAPTRPRFELGSWELELAQVARFEGLCCVGRNVSSCQILGLVSRCVGGVSGATRGIWCRGFCRPHFLCVALAAARLAGASRRVTRRDIWLR